MEITKDNFYEKKDDLRCAECGGMAEYFLDSDESPLCEDCISRILREECNELRELNDLDDENEDDVELLNKLWEEQTQYHVKKKGVANG